MYLSEIAYSSQPNTFEHGQIYNYVRDLSILPHAEAIDLFYRLLWDGAANPNESVQKSLKKIVTASNFDQVKLNLVNRCYYTLTNPWHLDGGKDFAIERLILWLEDMPLDRGQNPITRRLRDTLRLYREDERYSVLRRHLRLLDTGKKNAMEHFGDRFPDYFFIYEAGTQTPDIENSAKNLNEGIRQRRNRKLGDFRQDLNRFYVRYHRSDSTGTIHGLDSTNTTGLSDQELIKAMDLYRPRRPQSFKTQADGFKANTRSLKSVKDFKHAVHDHTMQPIQQLGPKYAKRFSRIFQLALDGFQQEVPLTQIVKTQIFRRLLTAIFQSNSSHADGDQFCYLINGVEPDIITSILLNLVLTCEMIRFDLEKRFAHLHYRFSAQENSAMQWLAAAFDHMNVALALNAKYLGYFTLGASDQGMIADSV